MAAKEKKIYTVAQVNSLVKVALEENLPSRMTVTGQISDYKRHFSGHCYFSLKDESGILPCVMWASKAKALKLEPENGLEVLATGNIDVYAPGGKYQFYVDRLQQAGVGELQLAYEQMVKRLQKEGLFEDKHKKTIPPYPMRVGIVTSESGAAVKDIAASVYDRWPCVRLFLYPVTVQGEGAAVSIATAIRDINKRNKKLNLDILIVGRGGGSLEDLWAFNEEAVARAIFDSKIPVISAVGHEVDITIADLVADARASTPTKAGVIAVPDIEEVLERINSAQRHLDLYISGRVAVCKGQLEKILASAIFKNPLWVLNNPRQQLDEVAMKLSAAVKEIFAGIRQKIEALKEKLLRMEPHWLMGQKNVELNRLQNNAEAAIKSVYTKKQLQLTVLENRLTAMDPRSVLKRGYSITTNKRTGGVVSSAKDVKVGDVLVTELKEKEVIESEVKKHL
ncbi:MAG: exodeoxyribonuclease VII large subunit [Sedimentisphaerales bacterium]|nr:exodeoxyribonuclease VII large subunit [Sedimentisphaerales bacterium]